MPLLWLSLAFLTGIGLADLFKLPVWGWLALGAAGWFSWGIARLARRNRSASRLQALAGRSSLLKSPLPLAVLWLAFCAGAARYQLSQPRPTPDYLMYYNDQAAAYALEGILSEPPDVRDGYTNLRLAVERLRLLDEEQYHDVKGSALLRVLPGGDWQYGDRLLVEGWLQTPPEGELFSYRDYLIRQGIQSLITRAQVERLERAQGNWLLSRIYQFKARLLQAIYLTVPDPEASLMAGILLGVETGIPEAVRKAFQATGTAHVIAISGFNISVLAGLFFRLFSRPLGRWRGALFAALGIIFYTILVGADPPVVRAAILGSLSLAAGQIGRRQVGLNSLAFVAALMALFQPNILWDVGFQLSFAATLGLVLYADPIQATFTRLAARKLPQPIVSRLAGPVGEYILLTLAAQVTVLPVTAYHFRQLSLSMLIANPLILPVQPAVMILGGLAMTAGLIWNALGQALAYAAWTFTAYTIRVVELFGGAPAGVIHLGRLSLGFVILYYGLLFAATFAWDRLSGWLAGRLKMVRLAVPLTGLFVAAILVWRAGFQSPDGRLHLTVLDVGREGISGEGLLIQTPGGRFALINGGPSANRLSDALGRRLPMTLRKLDALIVAGVQDGQLESLPTILSRYPPGMVIWAGETTASRSARQLAQALEAQRIPVTALQTGQALDLGEGARLEALATGKRGAVLLLEWRDFRALLPVGMSFKELEALEYGKVVGRVTALLMANSGYAPLNPPAWFASLNPQIILLSVAAGDKDGLPDAETLEAVEGYTLLRTDRNGWIELTTDGEQMWVEVQQSALP